jgi:hypothetical protein
VAVKKQNAPRKIFRKALGRRKRESAKWERPVLKKARLYGSAFCFYDFLAHTADEVDIILPLEIADVKPDLLVVFGLDTKVVMAFVEKWELADHRGEIANFAFGQVHFIDLFEVQFQEVFAVGNRNVVILYGYIRLMPYGIPGVHSRFAFIGSRFSGGSANKRKMVDFCVVEFLDFVIGFWGVRLRFCSNCRFYSQNTFIEVFAIKVTRDQALSLKDFFF